MRNDVRTIASPLGLFIFMKRISITKKTRFEVFKRDSFSCQYCYAKPPKVPLEIDHIIPVSKGGTNQIDNLVTACFDCNRGKSDTELQSIPETLQAKIEKKTIALKQYNDFQKLLKKEANDIGNKVNEIEKIFMSVYPDLFFTDRFRISVRQFLSKLEYDEVVDAMEKSVFKIYNPEKSLKYFCGICWNKIKQK